MIKCSNRRLIINIYFRETEEIFDFSKKKQIAPLTT